MAKIKCPKCGKKKAPDEFAWRYKKRGRRSAECRVCHAQYRKDYYNRNKKKTIAAVAARRLDLKRRVYEYLEQHPCVDCGEREPVLLDFDHVRGSKRMGICDMVNYGYGWKRIQQEIKKCEVRCVRCHRLRTAREERWYVGIGRA